jgi:hypothetical protein
MSVNHGRFDIFMPEQFLYRANIVTSLEEMGGKAVAKGVRTDRFVFIFANFAAVLTAHCSPLGWLLCSRWAYLYPEREHDHLDAGSTATRDEPDYGICQLVPRTYQTRDRNDARHTTTGLARS